MKKLWLVPTLAAAAIAAGCGSQPQGQGQGQGTDWQTCTDQQGRVVDERQCDPRGYGYHPGMYHWYYYPYGGRPYPIGWGVPLGGYYANAPVPGVPSRLAPLGIGGAGARAGVVRGGFGSTAAGRAAAS